MTRVALENRKARLRVAETMQGTGKTARDFAEKYNITLNTARAWLRENCIHVYEKMVANEYPAGSNGATISQDRIQRLSNDASISHQRAEWLIQTFGLSSAA